MITVCYDVLARALKCLPTEIRPLLKERISAGYGRRIAVVSPGERAPERLVCATARVLTDVEHTPGRSTKDKFDSALHWTRIIHNDAYLAGYEAGCEAVKSEMRKRLGL